MGRRGSVGSRAKVVMSVKQHVPQIKICSFIAYSTAGNLSHFFFLFRCISQMKSKTQAKEAECTSTLLILVGLPGGKWESSVSL
jgi:hypothetical protein